MVPLGILLHINNLSHSSDGVILPFQVKWKPYLHLCSFTFLIDSRGEGKSTGFLHVFVYCVLSSLYSKSPFIIFFLFGEVLLAVLLG